MNFLKTKTGTGIIAAAIGTVLSKVTGTVVAGEDLQPLVDQVIDAAEIVLQVGGLLWAAYGKYDSMRRERLLKMQVATERRRHNP